MASVPILTTGTAAGMPFSLAGRRNLGRRRAGKARQGVTEQGFAATRGASDGRVKKYLKGCERGVGLKRFAARSRGEDGNHTRRDWVT